MLHRPVDRTCVEASSRIVKFLVNVFGTIKTAAILTVAGTRSELVW